MLSTLLLSRPTLWQLSRFFMMGLILIGGLISHHTATATTEFTDSFANDTTANYRKTGSINYSGNIISLGNFSYTTDNRMYKSSTLDRSFTATGLLYVPNPSNIDIYDSIALALNDTRTNIEYWGILMYGTQLTERNWLQISRNNIGASSFNLGQLSEGWWMVKIFVSYENHTLSAKSWKSGSAEPSSWQTSTVIETNWQPNEIGFRHYGRGTYSDDLSYKLLDLCDTVTEIPTSECQSLLDLYNNTGGANWTNKTGWNENNTPCSWFGITCSGGLVQKLDLSSNKLTGALPNLNLPNLQMLYLPSNQLSGSIPNFSNLPNLQGIYLHLNQLSGNIPNFTNLPNLKVIYISSNQLSGNIPNFSDLPKLEGLYLHSNQLTGNIPNFSNLPNLVQLRLYANQLVGNIPNFSNLSKLQYLYLSYNQLNGIVPNFTSFNLANLQQLFIHNNCALTAYGSNQEAILNQKDSIWKTLNPSCPKYTVTLGQSGNGSGTMNGGGSFVSNTVVNLTATPDANSIFTGWSPSPCNSSFQMPANSLTCTANFALGTYTLTLSKTGDGTISANGINCGTDCSETYNANTQISLTATPTTGFKFVNWSGDCSGITSPLTITMDKAKTCNATFEKQLFKVTLNKTGNGSGNVDIEKTYTVGTTVNLTAIPDANSNFKGWSCANSFVVPSTNSFAMPANDLVCTATFSLKQFSLKVNKVGNGTISTTGINCGSDCDEIYNINTPVALIAVPSSGFIFSNWSGDCSVNTNRCSLTMNAAKNVTANFTQCVYTFDPNSANYNANTNYGSLEISAPDGCAWRLATSEWINQSVKWQDTPGTGRGTLSYGVPINLAKEARTGVIQIGDKIFTITQQPNQLPVANFSAIPSLNGNAPLTVEVDASSSSDPEGNPLEYQWQTSNGQAATNKTASFIFDKEGSYTITLTVKDNIGQTHSQTQNVNVSKIPCSFKLTPSTSLLLKAEGDSGSFTVDAPSNCTWNAIPPSATSGISFTSSTTGNGIGTVNYKIDPNPDTKERSVDIRVQDQIFTVKQAGKTPVVPIAQFAATPEMGLPPFVVQLDASSSYDPDGGKIEKYEWIAIKEDDPSITLPALGVNPSLPFNEKGAYLLTLKITDDENQFTEITQKIIANDAYVSFVSDKDHYHAGEHIKVTLADRVDTSRVKRTDLWAGIQFPDGTIFLRTSRNIVNSFITYDPPNENGQAFIPNVERINDEFLMLDLVLPLNLSGKYIFYAVHVDVGKNPFHDTWRSNLAIKEITLE